MSEKSASNYWKANIKLVFSLLCIWFLISFGGGILFVDFLDGIRFGGFKLGFWISQQGSIFVFIALIFAYIRAMDKLDSQYKQQPNESDDERLRGDAQ
jgi:putative solute:sodium symporter small subunit